MQQHEMKGWGYSDSTAEDLIFSSIGSFQRIFRSELEDDKAESNPSLLPPVCLAPSNWLADDFTLKEPSPLDKCTLIIRETFSKLEEKNEEMDTMSSGRKIFFTNIQREDNSLLNEIYDTYKDCAEENWDGYDAKPITIKSCLNAMNLANSLPDNLPTPEILPEPTGEIAFEWYRSKGYVFVMSVNDENSISYAGLFGKNSKSYGSEYFNKSLPPDIVTKIRRIFT